MVDEWIIINRKDNRWHSSWDKRKNMNEKRKPTYPAALNMAKLIYTLATEARSLTLEDILRILDISERTARRYLKAINEFLSNRQGEPLLSS